MDLRICKFPFIYKTLKIIAVEGVVCKSIYIIVNIMARGVQWLMMARCAAGGVQQPDCEVS